MGKKGRKNRSSSSSRTTTLPTHHVGGLYAEYKRATESFKSRLASLVGKKEITSVLGISKAVQSIVKDRGISIPPELLWDLDTAIHIRQRVTATFKLMDKQVDEGHSYYISVLKYCRNLLGPKKDIVGQDDESAAAAAAAAAASRFEVLALDEQEEEDDEDEETNGEQEDDDSPKPPTPPKNLQDYNDSYYSMDKLLFGDEHFRAATFLITLNDLMKIIHDTWADLKLKWRAQRNAGRSCFQMLVELTKATVVTNTVLKHVHHLEQLLSVEMPHLSTFYHVLAVMFFSKDYIQFFVQIGSMNQKGTKEELFPKVLDCIAQLVQIGFTKIRFIDAIQAVKENHHQAQIKRLVQLTAQPETTIKVMADSILMFTASEVLQRDEEELYQKYYPDHEINKRPKSHQWLSHLKYIGGPNSILNTHHLLQSLIPSLQNKHMIFAPYSERCSWDEQTRPATQLVGDMDNYMVRELLPELAGRFLNRARFMWQEELVPLFEYLRITTSTVSITLSFGFHAILMATKCMQGDQDASSLAVHCKLAFAKYFDQVHECLLSELPFHSTQKMVLNEIMAFKILTEESQTRIPKRAKDRAYWNPYCAGQFITYLSMVSFHKGTNVMDAMMQGRMTLHLYNALQQRQLLQQQQEEEEKEEIIPMVSQLYQIFQNASAIFPGDGPPPIGKCSMFAAVSFGTAVKSAAHGAKMKQKAKSTRDRLLVNFICGAGGRKGQQELSADQFSRLYSILIHQDFSGMQQQQQQQQDTPEQNEEQNSETNDSENEQEDVPVDGGSTSLKYDDQDVSVEQLDGNSGGTKNDQDERQDGNADGDNSNHDKDQDVSAEDNGHEIQNRQVVPVEQQQQQQQDGKEKENHHLDVPSVEQQDGDRSKHRDVPVEQKNVSENHQDVSADKQNGNETKENKEENHQDVSVEKQDSDCSSLKSKQHISAEALYVTEDEVHRDVPVEQQDGAGSNDKNDQDESVEQKRGNENHQDVSAEQQSGDRSDGKNDQGVPEEQQNDIESNNDSDQVVPVEQKNVSDNHQDVSTEQQSGDSRNHEEDSQDMVEGQQNDSENNTEKDQDASVEQQNGNENDLDVAVERQGGDSTNSKKDQGVPADQQYCDCSNHESDRDSSIVHKNGDSNNDNGLALKQPNRHENDVDVPVEQRDRDRSNHKNDEDAAAEQQSCGSSTHENVIDPSGQNGESNNTNENHQDSEKSNRKSRQIISVERQDGTENKGIRVYISVQKRDGNENNRGDSVAGIRRGESFQYSNRDNDFQFLRELNDRLAFIVDCVEEEKDALRFNFFMAGELLNEFIVQLVDTMEWHDNIQELTKMRDSFTKARTRKKHRDVTTDSLVRRNTSMLLEDLLGELDCNEESEKGQKAAQCMKDFFGRKGMEYTFY